MSSSIDKTILHETGVCVIALRYQAKWGRMGGAAQLAFHETAY